MSQFDAHRGSFATTKVLTPRSKSSKSTLIGGLVGGIVAACLVVYIVVMLWKTGALTGGWYPLGSRVPSRATRELSEVESGPMDRGY
jgi:hypothetical protein